uniref:Uncharacterized protein n=1 Tax=Plectus sambesii TaxID=2011161 RepID=A0A914WLK6_9BILA
MGRHGKKRNPRAASVIIYSPPCNNNDSEEREPDVGILSTRRSKARKPRKIHWPIFDLPPTDISDPTDADEYVGLTRYDVYIASLRVNRSAILLSDRRSAALADCDDRGQLMRNTYVIVKVLQVGDERQEMSTVLVCSGLSKAKCSEFVQPVQRQDQSTSAAQLPAGQVARMEECIHVRAARYILLAMLNPFEGNIVNVVTNGCTVDRLQSNPLMYAVKCVHGTFGVIRKGPRHLRCKACGKSTRCSHLVTLKSQADERNFAGDLTFKASTEKKRMKKMSKA